MEPPDACPDPGPLPPPTATAPTTPTRSATAPSAPIQREFAPAATSDTPGHRVGEVQLPERLPMAVFRFVAAIGFAGAFGTTGFQLYRMVTEEERSADLSTAALLAGLLCLGAVLAWTYTTVENARRLLAAASSQEPPDPWRALTLWMIPGGFVAVSSVFVVSLTRRWNTPIDGTTSSTPLIIAFGAVLVTLLLTYAPLSYLAGVVRRLGGQSVNLRRWAIVPVAFALVGSGVLVGMRAAGMFEGNEDGLVPTWIMAILLFLPIVVTLFVAFGAARDVEDTVARVFDRRRGRQPALHRNLRRIPSVFGADRPNRAALKTRGPIRLLPGANYLRLALVTLLAGLALLSVVGAIVMFLFWQESNDGQLLASQIERAWEVLDQLQTAERVVAFGLLAVVMAWSFVAVFNIRMASGRRRNPFLAALAWPVGAAIIWNLGGRLTDDDDATTIVLTFVLQSAILYVPFFLLERSATAIGARRSPIRIVFAVGVVLLVHVQGLGGLSTIDEVADAERFGRIAGYLAISALVQLLSTLAVTEASEMMTDAAEREAEHHNFLYEQRQHLGAQGRPDSQSAPQVAVPTD